MKTLKEKKMLVRMQQRIGEPVDPALLEEIAAEEAEIARLSESRQAAFKNMFASLSSDIHKLIEDDKKKTAEEQELLDRFSTMLTKIDEIKETQPTEQIVAEDAEELLEEVVEEFTPPPEAIEEAAPILAPIEEPSLAKEAAKKIKKKDQPPSMFVQPEPAVTSRDLKEIQRKLQLMEGWVSKISMAGPGGGAVWLRDLDDVARSSVLGATEGQVLTFNATTKRWEAKDITITANGVVGTLHQVTTAGNTTNNSITANGVHSTHFAANLTAGYAVSTGEIAWNPADLTFDMGMANGVTLQVGQEQYIKIKAANNITNGKTVMFAGVDGEHILGMHTDPSVPGFRPEWFIGIATQDITKNGFGYITTFGKVHDVNTLAWTAGDILYVDPTVVGGLTNVEPSSFNIMVAAVTKRAGGDGHVMVRPTWRPYLDQINGVTITSPANGHVLMYIASSNTWVNHTIDGFQTTAGLSANVATLTSNNSLYLGGIAANQYAFANQVIASSLHADNTSILQAANGQLSFNANTSLFMYQTTNTGAVNLLRLYGYSGESLEFGTGSSNGILSIDAVNHGAAQYANLTISGKSVTIKGGVIGGQGAWTFSNTTLTFPDNSTQTTAWTGSVATLAANNASYLGGIAANQYAYTNAEYSQISWTNDSPTPGDPFKTIISANNGAAIITLFRGLPGLGSSKVWSFDDVNVTFPDNTTQSTAFTGSANNASYLGGIAANQYAYANAIPSLTGYVQNTYSGALSGNLSLTGANVTITQGLSVGNNVVIGSDTRAIRTVLTLNTMAGYYSGFQVTRASSEQWFAGADTGDRFVIRRNATTDEVSINNTTGMVTIGNLTVGNTIVGTANNALNLGGIAADQYAYANALASYQTTAGLSANVATLTANNTAFVGTTSAANVVSNTQLQSNLANYQTTAGLSANVATLTANNATNLGGTAASGYAKLNANATFANVTTTATVTSNAAVAFVAGIAANSGVALQMPHEGALRNMSTAPSTMYFDVNNGGSTHGNFNFRSSNNFTSLFHLSSTQATFGSGMSVSGQTPFVGRTSYNVALDTVVTVDNLKFRISNQGGVFPQIASASGSTVDVCYDVLGIIAGTTNPAYANNSGYILLADGTWLSIYSSHGMDSRSDRLTAHITDKAAGKIYRVTYMKTNNNSNVDGYNIIVERIL